MKNTDSDTESDKYESAEESFNEDEDITCNKNSGTDKKVGESEKYVEPVVLCTDAADSSFQVKNDRSPSLSYRKRPERVKKLGGKSAATANTIVNKTHVESIFKPDVVSPDNFLQDFTSNLSKNLNKSINCLQQKSSNVKELILNSLPTSSVNENENRFLYDEEKNVFSDVNNANTKLDNLTKSDICLKKTHFEENKEKLPFESEKINKIDHVEEIQSVLIKEKENEVNNDVITNSINENAPEKNLNDVGPNSTSCNFEENKVSLTLPEKHERNNQVTDFDDYNQNFGVIEDVKSEEFSNVSEENSNKNIHVKEKKSVAEFLNLSCQNSMVKNENQIQKQLEVDQDDINSLITNVKNDNKDSQFDNCINQASGFGINYDIVNKNHSITKNYENVEEKYENFKENYKNVEENYKNVEENYENFEENVEKEISNTKPTIEADFISDLKDTNIIAKTSLEENCTIKKKNPNQSHLLKFNSNITETVSNIPESSNDGWDDFDFSDNELEKSISEKVIDIKSENEKFNDGFEQEIVSESKPREKLDIAKNDLKVKGKSLKSNETYPSKQSTSKKFENASNNSDLKEKTMNNFEENDKETKLNKAGEIKVQTNEKIIETPVEDNWDWDSWDDKDETLNSKSCKGVVQKSEKNTNKNLEANDFLDVSRWSGWDTFGQKCGENQRNWNMSSWGVDMLLNKASAVSQGISNVLEAGLGAPDPETLARLDIMEREKVKEEKKHDSVSSLESLIEEEPKKGLLMETALFPVFGISSLVAGVTSKIVDHSKIQEFGSKVLSGGLDTLESVGKKTMEVLQEGDPGLKNKRALFMGTNKPVLSQVLKEARERAETEFKKMEEKEMLKKCHFETLFDDFQGMVHLEALEMLSRQCELKLEQIKSGLDEEEQADLNGILEEVEQLCSLDDSSLDSSSMVDFKLSLNMVIEPLKDEISIKKILQVHEEVEKWLQTSSEAASSAILHQRIVSTLADLTAATVHQFHKAGELLLVKECRKTVDEIDVLSRMTNLLCKEISQLCERFITLSHDKYDKELEEKVKLIMKNSRTYIKQAFTLLIPVLQVGAAA